MKKIFKRGIAIFLCLTMIFNYSFSVLADENVESSETETTYTETVETTESSDATESIEEIESEGGESDEEVLDESSEEIEEPEEAIEEEPEEDSEELIDEPEEDLPEEVEDIPEEVSIEEVDISSPSEITDEPEEEENDNIPADMEDEPEEDLPEEIEEPALLGSTASPSEVEEEKEEIESGEEIKEATPSEIEDLPMLTMTPPLFGSTGTITSWSGLQMAIAMSSPGDEYTLGNDITVTSTYTIDSAVDVTIDLNGHNIDGDGKQIFILKGKLKIQDSGTGGSISGASNSSGSGGAVAIKGTGELTLDSGTFRGNSAKNGGAISIDEEGGKFIMNGGKISNNTASTSGAGIYASLLNETTFIEMNGGEISGNTASFTGGGIYIRCTEMKLNGGKIINNTAEAGAGICISNNTETKLYLGGNSAVKDNAKSSGDIDNIYLFGTNSTLYISATTPLTSGAEFYVTVKIDTAGDWGLGKDVGQYFNSTMTDSNYQYFKFTNCGNIEKNTVYSVKKSGGNYVTAGPVCKIGATEYATLADALTAVTSGQTITMLDNISYTDGTDFIIDGKTVTIDFDSHSMTVNTGTSSPTVTKLFTVTNTGNLTVDSAEIVLSGMYNSVAPFTVTGVGSKLTLNGVTQASNLRFFLTLDGGTATINGGTFGNGENIKMNLTNNATLKLTGNPTFNYLGKLINVGADSNTDPDTINANVTIDNGTYNNGSDTTNVIVLNAKANITINGGTFTSSGLISAPILVGNAGYKSSVTINNFTSDSPYIFSSYDNSNIESFTATINNGHFKYNKGQFAIDRNSGLKPNIKLNGGFYGPDTADDDALNELTAICASGKQIQTLTSSDAEYANGYRYKVYSNTPAPNPHSGGGSSGGGGGGAGLPKYDTLGNIIGPGAMQNYIYDGTNPPNLTGNITVSHWDYNTANAQVADIHYVQNMDSFVRGNNNPVITEWVGITTNTNQRVLWYRTNANGQILRNQFIQIGTNIYYFDNNGIMVTGQYTINGKVYNFETTVGATEGRLLY